MFVPDPMTINSNESHFFTPNSISPGSFDSPSTGESANLTQDEAMSRRLSIHSSSARQQRTLAPNLTRRSHKKSRAGCYTCKSRKIKCGEQKPKCGNCLLKGLTCVYPVVDQPRKRNDPLLPAKRQPSGTSPGTATFTMLDMKFFHHFLTTAYPHLPLGNDHVWVNEIPQFAEHQEYLMHAILSLGASHLGRLTGVDYRKESLTHRGQAIAGLNQALSQKADQFGEGDAMLAACYALTFQASYMGDGLEDFITMVRGCALTTAKIRQEDSPTAFNLQPDWHFKVMAPRLDSLPKVNPELLEEASEALDSVKPFLATEVDNDFHDALTNVITSLHLSPRSGYLRFIGVYAVWYELCADSFKSFLDPHNLPAQLLLAFFISIQMLMVPLAAYEWPDRADSTKARTLYGTIEWADNIFDKIKGTALEPHLQWPKRIINIVVSELGGTWSPDSPSVLKLDLPITPGEGSDVLSVTDMYFWEDASRSLPNDMSVPSELMLPGEIKVDDMM